MRAKVASRARGHALEPRFTKLNPVQLAVLYKQAVAEESHEKKEQVELIRIINEVWMKTFDSLFKELKFFVNPNMYDAVLKLQELDHYRDEVKAEEFPQVWEELMKTIPQTMIVENDAPQDVFTSLPGLSAEDETHFAGWVPAKTFKERGGE